MQFSYKIYYEDTDAIGIMYHANYIKFFERARTDMLEELNFSNSRLKSEHNSILLVCDCNIKFIKPAFLDDKITIKIKILKINQASLNIAETAYNSNSELLVESGFKIACVNKDTLFPMALPQELLLLFNNNTKLQDI